MMVALFTTSPPSFLGRLVRNGASNCRIQTALKDAERIWIEDKIEKP